MLQCAAHFWLRKNLRHSSKKNWQEKLTGELMHEN